MSQFRSAHRTVVTEIKSFVVDNVSRTGAFRQSVSARISDKMTFHRHDVNVSDDSPHVIDDVSAVVGINSPEPVLVRMTQTRPSTKPPEPDVPPAIPQFEVSQDVYAGNDLPIVLRDENLGSVGMLNVVALNLVTGETETLLLRSDEPGVFTGRLKTVLSLGKGMDFDGVMNVRNGHTILLRHNTSVEEPVEAQVKITSQYVDATITSIPIVFPGRPIPIVIEDIDLSGRSESVTVINLSTAQEFNLPLVEIDHGVFYTQLNTSVEQEEDKMKVSDGESIVITFTSAKFADKSTVEDVVSVMDAHHVTVDLSVDPTVKIGDKLLVVLDDYNRAGAGSISIAVSNVRSREFVMVACRESVPNSGTFIGELPTRSGGTANGALGVQDGDTVQAVYVDTYGSDPIRIEANSSVVSSDVSASTASSSFTLNGEDSEPPLIEESTVEFIVNGLFYLNGQFNGRIEVYGMSEELTRCSILHA